MAFMRCQIAEHLRGGSSNMLSAIAGTAISDLVISRVTDTCSSDNYRDAWGYLFDGQEFLSHCELIGAQPKKIRDWVRNVLEEPAVLRRTVSRAGEMGVHLD